MINEPWRTYLLAFLIGFVLGWFLVAPAKAHDPNGNPAATEWMKGLYSKKGVCCSGSDATVLSDPDWTSDNGHYKVKLDGEWIDVPDDAVVDQPNLYGPALVWPIKGYNGTSIRCFIPGALS